MKEPENLIGSEGMKIPENLTGSDEEKEQEIFIRSAESRELPELTEMLFDSELGRRYYPTMNSLLKKMEQSFDQDCIAVLQSGSETAGLIWYRREGAFHTYPYLHMICVRPEWQRRGLGRMLLEYMENDVLQYDSRKFRTKIFLTAGTWNKAALRFYEQAGYHAVCTIPGLYRKKIDETLMMKECSRGLQ